MQAAVAGAVAADAPAVSRHGYSHGRFRARLAGLSQLAERGDEEHRLVVRAGSPGDDTRLQAVDEVTDAVDHRRSHPDAAPLQRGKHRLDRLTNAHDDRQPHRPGGALQAVGLAEQCLHRTVCGRAVTGPLQLHDRRRKHSDVLFRLLQKGLHQVSEERFVFVHWCPHAVALASTRRRRLKASSCKCLTSLSTCRVPDAD